MWLHHISFVLSQGLGHLHCQIQRLPENSPLSRSALFLDVPWPMAWIWTRRKTMRCRTATSSHLDTKWDLFWSPQHTPRIALLVCPEMPEDLLVVSEARTKPERSMTGTTLVLLINRLRQAFWRPGGPPGCLPASDIPWSVLLIGRQFMAWRVQRALQAREQSPTGPPVSFQAKSQSIASTLSPAIVILVTVTPECTGLTACYVLPIARTPHHRILISKAQLHHPTCLQASLEQPIFILSKGSLPCLRRITICPPTTLGISRAAGQQSGLIGLAIV